MKKVFLLLLLISLVTSLSAQSRVDKNFTVNGVTFTMVYVDGGSFMMGSSEDPPGYTLNQERPVHKVTLSGYYIGKYEVSQRLWQAVMGSDPSPYKNPMPDNEFIDVPVHNVSWNDCQEFIRKLNKLTGRQFRLPTEAEWEFAARGGVKSRGYKYAGSDNPSLVAWFDRKSPTYIGPSRDRRGNELGIYDMSGNVCEWCQDWYGDYSKSAQTNPKGPSSGSSRVNRGGGWAYPLVLCRVTFRNWGSPSHAGSYVGLRLAL